MKGLKKNKNNKLENLKNDEIKTKFQNNGNPDLMYLENNKEIIDQNNTVTSVVTSENNNFSNNLRSQSNTSADNCHILKNGVKLNMRHFVNGNNFFF